MLGLARTVHEEILRRLSSSVAGKRAVRRGTAMRRCIGAFAVKISAPCMREMRGWTKTPPCRRTRLCQRGCSVIAGGGECACGRERGGRGPPRRRRCTQSREGAERAKRGRGAQRRALPRPPQWRDVFDSGCGHLYDVSGRWSGGHRDRVQPAQGIQIPCSEPG